jgi:hypothetical protein
LRTLAILGRKIRKDFAEQTSSPDKAVASDSDERSTGQCNTLNPAQAAGTLRMKQRFEAKIHA